MTTAIDGRCCCPVRCISNPCIIACQIIADDIGAGVAGGWVGIAIGSTAGTLRNTPFPVALICPSGVGIHVGRINHINKNNINRHGCRIGIAAVGGGAAVVGFKLKAVRTEISGIRRVDDLIAITKQRIRNTADAACCRITQKPMTR